MKYYDIKNFRCSNCDCDVYEVIDLKKNLIVCSKCGNEIPKSDVEVRFCPNCGNKLD